MTNNKIIKFDEVAPDASSMIESLRALLIELISLTQPEKQTASVTQAELATVP